MGNNNEHSSQNGFLIGFILGAILAGGAVFLFGTEKGRKLLKTLTEEGVEGISDLEEYLGQDEGEFSEPPASSIPQPVENRSNGSDKPKHSVRRFFRKIPKKS